jgi:ABC-2 type transport system ATP-binding protein
MNAVETHQLTKIYDNRLIAANEVSLTVPQGSVFGLVGSNGAGKTTTLRLILGLHKPSAGSVAVFGEKVGLSAGHLRKRIGYLSQTASFPPNMTPISYLGLVGRIFGIPEESRKARLSALIHAVDLLPASFQRIQNLSTGMRTRLGIAASLINDPDLLLWDEPTIGLDPTGRKYTLDLVRALKKEGKTVILSTHILSDADQVCDYLGILNHGKLIFTGNLTEMKKLTQRDVVDLSLAGDVDRLLYSLATEEQIFQCERVGDDVVRVAFTNGRSISTDLTRVLEAISRQGVEILSIRTAGEIEDAFLKRLEEDRLRGFSRPYVDRENSSLFQRTQDNNR